MRRLTVLLAIVVLPGCHTTLQSPSPQRTERKAVLQIRNTDIAWEGTHFGLVPAITSGPSLRVLRGGVAQAPALIEALSDPERFVAAHVILTSLCGAEHPLSASQWNGLVVSLNADGRTTIAPDQMHRLKVFWSSRPCLPASSSLE